ncbi:virion structural protein [Pseudomonas phage D6]|nr:virion structural protein [Pseudomonas phage D6]
MVDLTFVPYDLTGKALSNRRRDEVHNLITVAGKTNRAFVCKFGAFYSASMVIRDATTAALKPGIDYKTVYHYDDVSTLTGKEVMGFVVVTNPNVKSPVTVEYQALGGPFSISADELRELLNAIDETNFPFVWGDIIGKPTAYKPKDHLHKYWQLYGLETTVKEIDRIAAAWEKGNSAVMNENETYADEYLATAKAEIDKYQAAVNAHLRDFNNPHRVTTLQVQREKLNNWGFSGVLAIADPNNNNTYFPIGGVYQILAGGLIPALNAHIINFNNPHGVTADMANVYTKTYVNSALALKLRWNEPSTNSSLFGGIGQAAYSNQCRTNIPIQNVVSGRFPYTQLGTGYGSAGGTVPDYVLTGNSMWSYWKDFLKPLNDSRGRIAYIGAVSTVAQALNILNTVFADATTWPVGSLALAQYHLAPYDTQQRNVWTFQRTAGGWSQF